MGLEVRAHIKKVISVLPMDSIKLLPQGLPWKEENLIEKERVRVVVLLECYGQEQERRMTILREEWEDFEKRGWMWW